MGLKGIVLLKDFLPYQTKQSKKVKNLRAHVEGDGIELTEQEGTAPSALVEQTACSSALAPTPSIERGQC